jgi:hypothetical protein
MAILASIRPEPAGLINFKTPKKNHKHIATGTAATAPNPSSTEVLYHRLLTSAIVDLSTAALGVNSLF